MQPTNNPNKFRLPLCKKNCCPEIEFANTATGADGSQLNGELLVLTDDYQGKIVLKPEELEKAYLTYLARKHESI